MPHDKVTTRYFLQLLISGTITTIHGLLRHTLITTGLHWTRAGRRLYR